MQCPDCGFVLTDFETECLRCKRMGKPKPKAASSPVRVVTDPEPDQPQPRAVPLASALPAAPNAPVSASPPPVPPPSGLAPVLAQPFTADMLACVICGNQNVQKVSAICQSGSWSTNSRGYSTGFATDGQGNAITISGTTSSFSQGQTTLASRLSPPFRPVFRASWTGSVLTPLLGYFLTLCIFGGLGPWAATAVVVVTTAIWGVVLKSETEGVASAWGRYRGQYALWEHMIKVWDRTFYCQRCDHVYDPNTRRATGLPDMPHLLQSDAPAHAIATKSYIDDSATQDKAARYAMMACATGIAALVLIWWGAGAWQSGQQERAPSASEISSPLSVPTATSDQPASPVVPVKPESSPPANSGSPPTFTMRTESGGGPPPDPAALPH